MIRTVTSGIDLKNTGAGVILFYRDPIAKEDYVKRYLPIILIIFLPLVAISCSGTAWVEVANEHVTVTVDSTPYPPTIEVTVNGETKIVPSFDYEEWEISWVKLVPWEEVTVRASVSYPSLSNPGLYEESFRVKDGDVEDIVVTNCTGYQP